MCFACPAFLLNYSQIYDIPSHSKPTNKRLSPWRKKYLWTKLLCSVKIITHSRALTLRQKEFAKIYFPTWFFFSKLGNIIASVRVTPMLPCFKKKKDIFLFKLLQIFHVKGDVKNRQRAKWTTEPQAWQGRQHLVFLQTVKGLPSDPPLWGHLEGARGWSFSWENF